MNWVDFCVFLILFYFAYRGYAIGLAASLLNLVSAILAVLISIKYYTYAGQFFVDVLGANKFVGPILGFFALLILTEFILSLVFSFIYSFIHRLFNFLKPLYWIDKITGIIPQLALGVILLTVGMIVLLRLPVQTGIKDAVLSSYWGKTIVPQAALFEPQLRQALGTIPQETLLYLIPREPDSEDSIKMNFPDPENMELVEDKEAAQELFELVNKERTERGLKVLYWDPTIERVAVAYSFNMFRNSYFSHYGPDGSTPFDRMSKGEVQYTVAGENLAYAPTVEIAHKGLMNSPGHRENILRPEFGRIGIGVVDGGIYGKMFTQNFAD